MKQIIDSALIREALQSRLLVEIMGNAMHQELVLKGGMAMRVVHGSVRYTKDIDLDADPKFSKERVRGIVRRSIDRAIASGLIDHAQVSEPKQTETTLRWKIVGTQPGSNAPLHLTVEVSRRASLPTGHVISVPLAPEYGAGYAVGARVQVLDSQALAATKVFALTDPRRMAPRDLYDLHVLIDAHVMAPLDLLANESPTRLTDAMNELWPKIEAMSYAQFRSDVVPYLPPQIGQAIDEPSFDDMRVQVGTEVEKWIEQAQREVAP